MNTVTISSKYQVVIPRPIRDPFNLKPGQKIMFIPYKESLRIVIVPPIERAEGIFAGTDTDPQREKKTVNFECGRLDARRRFCRNQFGAQYQKKVMTSKGSRILASGNTPQFCGEIKYLTLPH